MDDNTEAEPQTVSVWRVDPGEALVAGGLMLVTVGVGLWSIPAGLITAGLALILTGIAWFRAQTLTDSRLTDALPSARRTGSVPPHDGVGGDV